MSIRPLTSLASIAAAAVLLAGCASPTTPADAPLAVHDAWVKTAESGMTAAFATLDNTTGSDVTVVAATSDAASSLELHEVVDGAMQELDAGMIVPAGGELVLQPGGLHLMLIGLTAPIVAGDRVEITLELADGATVEVTATAKDFDGGEEDYEPDGHDGMDADAGHAE